MEDNITNPELLEENVNSSKEDTKDTSDTALINELLSNKIKGLENKT